MPSNCNALDCDLRSGRCPLCHEAGEPDWRRNCPVLLHAAEHGFSLGTWLAIQLARIGITKAWWAGTEPSGCTRCNRREQELNRWSWTWQHKLDRAHWWVRHRAAWVAAAVASAHPTESALNQRSDRRQPAPRQSLPLDPSDQFHLRR